MGGYVAAVALRAAGAASPLRPPRQLQLPLPRRGRVRAAVDIAVEPLRAGRQAAQPPGVDHPGRPGDHGGARVVGRRHRRASSTTSRRRPTCPAPTSLRVDRGARRRRTAQPPFPFWLNFDARPLDLTPTWPPRRPARADLARVAARSWHWPTPTPTRGWRPPGWCSSPTCRAGRRPTDRTRGSSRRSSPPTLDLQVSFLDLVPDEPTGCWSRAPRRSRRRPDRLHLPPLDTHDGRLVAERRRPVPLPARPRLTACLPELGITFSAKRRRVSVSG